jgi:hypothetical protein
MNNFRSGEGGPWIVTQTLGISNEVINSCKSYEDAEKRACDLAQQSPDQQVTIYKAVERFMVGRTPVIRTAVNVAKKETSK